MTRWFVVVSLLAALVFCGVARPQEQKPSARLLGTHEGVAQAVSFSPDGLTLASSGYQDRTVRLWDAKSGKELRRFAHAAGASAVQFARDGKMIASAGMQESIRLWDPKTGKEIRNIEVRGHPFGVACSPDGKKLATVGYDRSVRIWESATGKELFNLAGHTARVWSVAFSPDGKLVSTGSEDGTVRLWDVATGKELHCLDGHSPGMCPVAFSPDGKWLATSGADRLVRLWDVKTGKERSRFEHANEILGLDFSPDGRTVAAGAYIDVSVRVWEVASGKEVLRFDEHKQFVPGVAFSPDGRSLATACRDGGVRIWDMTGRVKDGRLQPAKFTDRELADLWKTLQGEDAAKAYRAGWALAASEGQAVRYLKEKLHPAKRDADRAKRIAALIEQLDDDDFNTRQKASVDLEKLEGTAEDALRKVLAETRSLEVRRRATVLLQKLKGRLVPAAQTPGVRAVAVLERIGGADARAVLEALAKGDEESWLTRESKASLGRMTKR